VDPRASETIETIRLRGKRISRENEADLIAMEQDPRMFPTLWGRSQPPTVAEVRLVLDRHLEHWEHQGFAVWLLRDRTPAQWSGAVVCSTPT
jgi:hypothetical protein